MNLETSEPIALSNPTDGSRWMVKVQPTNCATTRSAYQTSGHHCAAHTGDEVIQMHACVVEPDKMLRGEPAKEQCVIIDGVNFLNNADIDGKALPPKGAPNIILAAGGTQLKKVLEDDGIFA
jgi:hypothetical protein